MLRVRPGVELVLASFAPSSELITLDLPTFDRPRKATSGSTGAGKWPASIADIMNRAKTRMKQCAVSIGKSARGRRISGRDSIPARVAVCYGHLLRGSACTYAKEIEWPPPPVQCPG